MSSKCEDMEFSESFVSCPDVSAADASAMSMSSSVSASASSLVGDPEILCHRGRELPPEDLQKLRSQLKDAFMEVRAGIVACHVRGLVNATKWLSEIYEAMKQYVQDFENNPGGSKGQEMAFEDKNPEKLIFFNPKNKDFSSFMLARTLFMQGEYLRAAHISQDCTCVAGIFLQFYAKYFHLEKHRLDRTADPLQLKPSEPYPELLELKTKLDACMDAGHTDGFLFYLRGIICKKLELKDEAIEAFLKSVHISPLNWSAWLELSALSTNRTILRRLVLPDHWMKYFFLAHVYLELQLNDNALELARTLIRNGFQRSLFLWTLVAIGLHNKRCTEDSIELFHLIRNVDPFRLDAMDVLSNLLYVRDEKEELAKLAKQAMEVDRFRVETSCIVGNLYSLRTMHEKSSIYFQRALKINPMYQPAWTLLGHEYMEMRNVNAAILAYRNAIEVNPRDYRAWYGLGQTYDLMKMHHHSIYYYRSAQALRPFDYRMYVAMGSVLENLNKNQAALASYQRAYDVGDHEGLSLVRFAKLYHKLKRSGEAASYYRKYLLHVEAGNGSGPSESLASAYKFLSDHSLDLGDLVEARKYAELFVNTGKRKDTKEEYKTLIKKIEEKEAALAKKAAQQTAPGASEQLDQSTSMSLESEDTSDGLDESSMDLDATS